MDAEAAREISMGIQALGSAQVVFLIAGIGLVAVCVLMVVLLIRATKPFSDTMGATQRANKDLTEASLKQSEQFAKYVETHSTEQASVLTQLAQSISAHDVRMMDRVGTLQSGLATHVTAMGQVTSRDIVAAFHPITEELRAINNGVQALLKTSGFDHAAQYRALADKIDGLKAEIARMERTTLKKLDTGELLPLVAPGDGHA